MEKWLVIGNGAREHAITKALSCSDIDIVNFGSAINPGIKSLVKEVIVGDIKNMDEIKKIAEQLKPDYAIVGPDDPIALGAADMLTSLGIPAFAPGKELAQIESSKGFARTLLEKYKVDALPEFFVCRTSDEVQHALETLEEYVVKADGLMGGKGVMVYGEHIHSHAEALAFAEQAIANFGQVVVEEKLFGVEFSLMSFADGTTVVDMPPVQDHKRAYEGDSGPNTGGMGSYSDADLSLPFLKPEHLERAHAINLETMQALKQEFGKPYIGILYGGFILTKKGVKLIEYNARFGDPECMNVLSLLKTPLRDIALASFDGALASLPIEFEKKATVLKYVVPEGYPEHPVKGQKITIDEKSLPEGVELYYSSVSEQEDGIYMSSSRAIAVLAKGDTLGEAEKNAENAAQCIHGPVFYRKDIGTKALIDQRVNIVNAF